MKETSPGGGTNIYLKTHLFFEPVIVLDDTLHDHVCTFHVKCDLSSFLFLNYKSHLKIKK